MDVERQAYVVAHHPGGHPVIFGGEATGGEEGIAVEPLVGPVFGDAVGCREEKFTVGHEAVRVGRLEGWSGCACVIAEEVLVEDRSEFGLEEGATFVG